MLFLVCLTHESCFFAFQMALRKVELEYSSTSRYSSSLPSSEKPWSRKSYGLIVCCIGSGSPLRDHTCAAMSSMARMSWMDAHWSGSLTSNLSTIEVKRVSVSGGRASGSLLIIFWMTTLSETAYW